MGQTISFKRPDGQSVQGYLAEPAQEGRTKEVSAHYSPDDAGQPGDAWSGPARRSSSRTAATGRPKPTAARGPRPSP